MYLNGGGAGAYKPSLRVSRKNRQPYYRLLVGGTVGNSDGLTKTQNFKAPGYKL